MGVQSMGSGELHEHLKEIMEETQSSNAQDILLPDSQPQLSTTSQTVEKRKAEALSDYDSSACHPQPSSSADLCGSRERVANALISCLDSGLLEDQLTAL